LAIVVLPGGVGASNRVTCVGIISGNGTVLLGLLDVGNRVIFFLLFLLFLPLTLKHDLDLFLLGNRIQLIVHVLEVDLLFHLLLLPLLLHLVDGFLAHFDQILLQFRALVHLLRGVVPICFNHHVEEVDHGVFYGLYLVTGFRATILTAVVVLLVD
jgi:hypothetical protein